MEYIRKLIVGPLVERDLETITDRISWGRLKRHGGAAVLELNTLVARVRHHRQHCGHKNKPAGGYRVHKHPLSLVTACAPPEFVDFESLAASLTESKAVKRTLGRQVLAPFNGFDPNIVVATISTLWQ